MELSKATKTIVAAIAWFNDRDIYTLLLEKAQNGVIVEILISDSKESNLENFSKLADLGGVVYMLPPTNKLMHHKYCIIDGHTLITGSYNWTWAARNSNLENIVIIENNIKLNSEYDQTFRSIVENEFKHIDEAINILDLMIDEINKAKEQINKYKQIPSTLATGIDKIKSSSMLSASTLSKLIEPEEEKPQGLNQDINNHTLTYEEKQHWWKSLQNSWKQIYNKHLLKLDYKLAEPDEELIDYLLNLQFIDCSLYNYAVVTINSNNNKEYTNYPKINDLSGISELKKLETIICNSLNITTLTPISGLYGLKKFICSNNSISTIEPLKFLKNLTHLEVQNNKNLATLKGIEYLTKLEYFKCDAKFLDFPSDTERVKKMALEITDNQDNIVEFRRII